MAIYFEISFFQKFQERPPVLRAVRALDIDTGKEINGIETIIRPCHKNQDHFKRYPEFLQSRFIISL